MKLVQIICAAAMGVSVSVIPASAHWQFTRWGMTPDQVIKASGGRAAWKDVDGQHQELEMDYPSGQYVLSVGFLFDPSSHLNHVEITNTADAAALMNQLKGKYGKPAEADKDGNGFTWFTSEDRISASRVGANFILIGYWPKTSRDASGL